MRSIRPSTYFQKTLSDKTGKKHDYTKVYDMFVEYLYLVNQQQPIRVLEIGVAHFGVGSGHAFCEMPFIEKYVGIDRKALQTPFSEKGIFIQGEAYSEDIFPQIQHHAPFHLIIDDGSHICEDQIFFFNKYCRFAADTTIMICEDIANNPRAINRRLDEIQDKSILSLTVPTSKTHDFLDNVALVKWRSKH